ncbi:hypothetical protein BX616_007058 [Lobosporangium transversale]|uniref:Uncharacterized protein n=1 Tax=Lobosporangium transversale TaxID=64571 RepID=A0A1Y2GAW2_9FUNG|nr:hypothetical protein BCR41DRAFT_425316 [Lobosporangium transversale]KAF9919334.1 hypothetical protein BX616_007058 [Lobosporangium transversale]ORZ05908.1 hypothetical protein BCR41DRAFT_425316 [Lobosporangium transversale]|eukprot:XP_021877289.1 hypothetical protein BCR41DRAFT_425316 [Lobosporangium transversale]
MAEQPYPKDVEVDMTNHDDAPPPFSAEDAVPLLADEKKHLHQDAFRAEAETPPRSRCPFSRRRCTNEQSAQCKAKAKGFFRRMFRRLLIALLAVWAFMAFFCNEDGSGFECESDELLFDGQCMSDDLQPWTAFNPYSAKTKAALAGFTPMTDMSNDDCSRDLVEWGGPKAIETHAKNIRLGFGKGNLLSNVIIRTGDVAIPTLHIRANVTKIHHHHHDDEDDDDDDDGDDNDDSDEDDENDGHPHKRHQGLHLKVNSTEETLKVSFWANNYVHNGDEHHKHRKHHKHHKHHRKHQKHHDHDREDEDEDKDLITKMMTRMYGNPKKHGGHSYKRFCAVIEVQIVLPPNDKDSLYSVAVGGVVLTIDAADVEKAAFKELILGSVAGEIKAGAVVADRLVAEIVTGAASVDSVKVATEGSPLNARIRSTAGDIKLNAKTSPITRHDEDDGDNELWSHVDDDNDNDNEDEDKPRKKRLTHHLIIVNSVAGAIDLDVAHAQDDDKDKHENNNDKTAPGMVVVRAKSVAGRVNTSVDLVKDQQLGFRSSSVSGKIMAKVSDKFLGKLNVGSGLGAARVIEAKNSNSKIVYEKDTIHSKVGYKFIEDNDDNDDNGNHNGEKVEGNIVIGSAVGEAHLEFF